MNRSQPANSAGGLSRGRWFLSLLATRPGRRLLHASLIMALAVNMGGSVLAEGSRGNSGELKEGAYSIPASRDEILRIPYSEGNDTQYAIRNTSSTQNPKSKTQNPYSNPAVQNALRELGLPLPGEQLAVSSEQLAVGGEQLAGGGAGLVTESSPAGSQFQVNSYTTNNQEVPSVAIDGDGDFVVVWYSLGSGVAGPGGAIDTSSNSIQGQRYNSAGVAQGSQFQVNSYTTGEQRWPTVAMDSDGDFVVVWMGVGSLGPGPSGSTDTDGYSIQGQRYNSAGTAQGSQFQVNSYITNNQRYPSVAVDSDGDFIVAWASNGSPGSDNGGATNYSIQGQRFNSAGTAQGSQFQVNSYTTNDQRLPVAAADSDGDFVIVWMSDGGSGDTFGNSIQGQRYNSAGTAQGSQFQVNSYTTSSQMFPAVAIDSDGDFVVVWRSFGSSSSGPAGGVDTSSYSIQGQRYNSAGTAQGSQFQVNSYTTNAQANPAVSLDSDGDFVVVWQSSGSSSGSPADTVGLSIQGQQYNSAGTAQGSQFQVNSYTTSDQFFPAVALDSDGDIVVAWESNGSPGNDTSGATNYSIQGQRFNPAGSQVNSYTSNDQLLPAVAMDSDGDFVVVWYSSGSGVAGPGGTIDISNNSIQGQRYNSAGTAQGSQFQVNSYTSFNQRYPAVAMDSGGSFVIVWESNGSGVAGPGGTIDTSDYSIQGQRYNSSGAAQGSQFQVNSYTTNFQLRAAVAMDSDGDFVVAWDSIGSGVAGPGGAIDSSSNSIQGQRYNSAGTAQGSQFQVNSYTTSNQTYPAVAMDSDGDFVVAWMSSGSGVAGPGGTIDTLNYSIQGQRYNSSGAAQGSQFQVNSYTTNQQRFPAMAMDSGGNFVIAWESIGGTIDTSNESIQGQRYNSSGTAQGSQFQVNSYTTAAQRHLAVAMDSDGDFVVVWESIGSNNGDSDNYSIQGRTFLKSGLPLWGEFQVNGYTSNGQRYPAVAIDSSGDFVVAWQSDGSPGNDSSGYSIQAGRFDLGQSDHQVNTYTPSEDHFAAVAVDSDGDFVIAWESSGSSGADSTNFSIQARLYDNGGVPRANQFQVNSYTTGNQLRPAVAMDSDGDFVIVWHSYGSTGTDTSFASIQARRYNVAGVAQGSEFQVNNMTGGNQSAADVAMDSDGDFVVVWQDPDSPGNDIFNFSAQARRYNSAGTSQGNQFQVNSYTTGDQFAVAVALDSDGDFVVVWESDGSSGTDTSLNSIQGQRYNSVGTAQGSQFQVNSYTTGRQNTPEVSLDSDGDFVVAWSSPGSSGTDSSDSSIQMQRYNSVGTAQGGEVQVNSYTSGSQNEPEVAMDSDGDFVIVWDSAGSPGNDGSAFSIQAQRYNRSGTVQGNQFQVNNYIYGGQRRPGLGLDSDGDFIVAWSSISLNSPFIAPEGVDKGGGAAGVESDANYGIAASRFTALGGPEPTALTLDSATLPAPRAPLAALLALFSALVTAGYLRLRGRKENP